jgi:chromosome segregation and condensation protein ScpB
MTDERADATDSLGSLEESGSAEPLELTEAALEALLFVAERPLTRREIADPRRSRSDDRRRAARRLEVSLRGEGIRLLVAGDRVELATAPEAGALIARYVGADTVRLSPAALETLAIVAYRQPVTKAASSGSAASTPTTRCGRCSIAG